MNRPAEERPVERPVLLVVDDEGPVRNQLKWALGEDYEVVEAGSVEEAIAVAAEHRPDVVTLDLALSEENPEGGFDLLDHFLGADPLVKVVMVTGNEDRAVARQAVERGAFDSFTKPFDVDELRHLLGRARALRDLERENEGLRRRLDGDSGLGGLRGRSPEMRDVFELIRKVAPTDVTLLVTGETGTGKELAAREIHRLSDRAEGPFVALNCGAIPAETLAAELFGHEKGAFAGAHQGRSGKLEAAEGGTVFLDEIEKLPLALQVDVLHVLQERSLRRVGGEEPRPLDVRVVAATAGDLRREVADGRFREDLYFRLSVVNVHLPPLRERPVDVAFLAGEFLRRCVREFGRGRLELGRPALAALQHYRWPGNVRELEHRIQRAAVLATGRVIRPEDLELDAASGPMLRPLREAREIAEREVVVAALRRNCGNIARSAKDLEISRPTMHDLLRKFDIRAAAYKNGMGPDDGKEAP